MHRLHGKIKEENKMTNERYDYRAAVAADIIGYIRENYTVREIAEILRDDRDGWEDELRDDLWTVDSVTGNASGSYTCNAWQAEEYICHNLDLLAEAGDEFGGDVDVLREGAEACDVTIRCYLLGECIAAALDELEESEDIAEELQIIEAEEEDAPGEEVA